MNPQLAGVEELTGTYPFDIKTSVRTFKLNRFLWGMTISEERALYKSDPETAFSRAGLSDAEKKLVRERDWRGLIHYGANFFVLEKLARIDGITNGHVYAAMRGEPFEEFLKTRNVPGAR